MKILPISRILLFLIVTVSISKAQVLRSSSAILDPRDEMLRPIFVKNNLYHYWLIHPLMGILTFFLKNL